MIGKFFDVLWAFIVEVFIKNEELKAKLKNPHYVIRSLFFIFATIFIIFFVFEKVGALLYNTHAEYRTISKEYLELNTEHRKFMLVINELTYENARIKEDLYALKLQNEKLLASLEELKKENILLLEKILGVVKETNTIVDKI